MTNNELTQIMQTINAVSKKVNDVQSKLETYINLKQESNNAKIDYIAMMSKIEIPENESLSKKDKLKKYYERGFWNEGMLLNAVDVWITQKDFNQIISKEGLAERRV